MQTQQWIALSHVAVVAVGVFVIGWGQLRIAKRMADIDEQLKRVQLAVLERTGERDDFVRLLDGIIELKAWAATQPTLMASVRDHDIAKTLVRNGVVKDEIELVARCKFFFHAEKLFYLSTRTGISAERRRGLNQEIKMWLGLAGMREFFYEFCEKAGCHSDEFLREARLYFTKGSFGDSEPADQEGG